MPLEELIGFVGPWKIFFDNLFWVLLVNCLGACLFGFIPQQVDAKI